MPLVGCDPGQLEDAAASARRLGESVARALDNLDDRLYYLEWNGDDAEQTRGRWRRTSADTTNVLIPQVFGLELRLIQNAADQRSTSSSAGSFAPVAMHGAVGALVGVGGLGEIPPIPIPSADSDPADVKRWWDSLSAEEQQRLITEHPDKLGNLDGIPPKVRYQANQIRIEQLLESESDPHGPLHKKYGEFVDPGRQILLFDVEGDGKLAEVFGDLETAKHVGVVVPGMGSDLGNFTDGVASDAYGLHQPGGESAVIAWTGYDAPDGLPSPEVLSAKQAEAGARALKRLVEGVNVQTDADVSVFSHSYGSLVAGKALMIGMKVENMMFMGSPGVGVDSVAEFPSGAAKHYYSMEIDGDPVADSEYFGSRPTDPDFGATRLATDQPKNPLWSHSEYYAGSGHPSAQLSNLNAILNGGETVRYRSGVKDYVREGYDDVVDGANRGINYLQKSVHIPVVDSLVDGVVDYGQGYVDKLDNAAEVVHDFVEGPKKKMIRSAQDFLNRFNPLD